MNKKRILIAAGGTGGHIFPAIATANQLSDSYEVAFAGGNLASNRYFEGGLYRFYSTSCAPFLSKNPVKLFQAMGNNFRGLWQSHRVIADFQPDLALGFGSYYTFPILVASLLNRVPVVLHEANSIPGKVNRLLSRYAHVTGIHFPDTPLNGKTTVVGMPLRFKKGNVTQREARAYFGLDGGRTTVLIFGGSQGAKALNHAVGQALSTQPNLQVIHITGADQSSIPYKIPAAVKAFETRMDFAWEAADFAISRAGAGTISEAMEFEVPLLLVPFPRAADNHQEKNADFMVKIGGGEKILENNLNHLHEKIQNAIQNLHQMRSHIRAYKQQMAHQSLKELISEILRDKYVD